ncbi:hypothetical protein AB0H43_12025 [Hamadaea sp. NPDC050747]|uniref:hypothetical protein n=1 Tax=Hamadaea sp. NPDC050747 TaxID=3155789 RepID=UPI0033DDF426
MEHRQDRPGSGEISPEQPQDGPLFLRMSIVATTALALAKAHVPAGAAEPCGRCGRPSPCPTAVHAREVVRLSMPRPLVPTAAAVPVGASALSSGASSPSVSVVTAGDANGSGESSAARPPAGGAHEAAGRSMLGLLDEEP